jgi:arylsulfatase A-like enzyme
MSEQPERPQVRSDERPTGLATLVAIAVSFALLSGFGDVVKFLLARYVLEAYVRRSIHTVWMAPVSHLLVFGALLLLFLAVALVRRRAPSLRVTTFCFSWLALLAIFLGVPKVSSWALVVLALGLATQATRLLLRYESVYVRSVRVLAPALLALLVVTATGAVGAKLWGARQALSVLPPPLAGAPNVLLIVMDTVRAQNMSVYGYGRSTTPELERLSQRGIVFDRAYSTAPWTLPAHASMVTGKYHHELSVGWSEPLDAADPTLAEVLATQGFGTGGFVANVLYCGEQSGLPRGFSRYDDYPLTSVGEILRGSTLGGTLLALPMPQAIRNARFELMTKRASKVNADFLGWLDDAGDRPFFAFVNYMDAHEPYLPPDPFALKFAEKRPESAYVDDDARYTHEQLVELMAAYDGGIAYVDHEIGRLLAELERRGKLSNTIIVVTSDHGEEFGEHGYVSHSNSLHVQGIHIPLIVALPSGEAGGSHIAEPVTLRDLPATILGLVGGTTANALPGESLARHWRGDSRPSSSPILSEVNRTPNIAPWLPVAKGDLKSIVSDDYHLIRNADGEELLFDLARDPYEEHDRIDAPELGDVFRALQAALNGAVATGRETAERASNGPKAP